MKMSINGKDDAHRDITFISPRASYRHSNILSNEMALLVARYTPGVASVEAHTAGLSGLLGPRGNCSVWKLIGTFAHSRAPLAKSRLALFPLS
jgi:hypothetical protein